MTQNAKWNGRCGSGGKFASQSERELGSQGEDHCEAGDKMALIMSVSGVRGIVRADDPSAITMTEDVARRVGFAYGTYLKTCQARDDVDYSNNGKSPLLVGGRDGRPSGEHLLAAFCEGAMAAGLRTANLGIVTTPGIALGVKALGGCGGVVITASHNPIEWNGIKLMTAMGQAPTKAAAVEIFAIFDSNIEVPRIEAGESAVPADFDIHERHVSDVLATVDVEAIRGRKFRVVLDSVNGAGAVAGRMLLDRLGCSVVHLNAESGCDFAHTPEPIAANLVGLCSRVASEGADAAAESGELAVGFAQDPDADRLAIVDETGRFIGEEYTLSLCVARVLAGRAGVVATNLSTSRMLEDIAAGVEACGGGGCRVVRSAVGEANVVEAMLAHDCVLGGEGNGGVIDPRVIYVRDSLVAMALVLDLLASSDRCLSEHVSAIPSYAMLKEKVACDQDQISAALVAVKDAFSDQSLDDSDGVRVDWVDERMWVHVRGSNTEPIMRLIVEAPTEEAARALMVRVREAIGSQPATS